MYKRFDAVCVDTMSNDPIYNIYYIVSGVRTMYMEFVFFFFWRNLLDVRGH